MADGVPGSEPALIVGPFDGRIDAELVRRYGEATADPSPAVRAGTAVPPVAVVTQIWHAQEAARLALVPPDVQRAAAAGVHGEHDIVLHRPVVVGELLHTSVDRWGTRPAGRNAAVTLRYVTRDAGGDVVAEQWWTTVYLGTSCEPSGAHPPDHAFPGAARDRPAGSLTVEVDDAMPRRYAAVSGDWSAHHFDVDAARRSGSDRPFLHGLCTMALCARAVVEQAAGGLHERVRRVAVRFAAPMPVGERLVVDLFDAGRGGIAFEATCGGLAVVTHGRAELR